MPEVIDALTEMDLPGCLYPPSERYPELVCRIAGIRPTVADVEAVGYIARTMPE